MKEFIVLMLALMFGLCVAMAAQAQDAPEVINNPNCVVIAPDWLQDGAQEWCNTGIFLTVQASGDQENKLFHAKMILSSDGYHVLTKNEEVFRSAFITVLMHFNDYGVNATLDVYFGEAYLLKCKSLPAPLCENAG